MMKSFCLALALAGAMAGCTTLATAVSPASFHADATSAYIATANWLNFDEAMNPARVAADDATRRTAWTVLQAERIAYHLAEPSAVATALDQRADALAPVGAPPPVLAIAAEAKPALTQEQAAGKLETIRDSLAPD